MKEPEEIKEGLRKCTAGVDCFKNCPYAVFGKNEDCIDVLLKDSREYIDNLEERVAIMTDRPIAHWIDKNGNLITFEKGGTVFDPDGATCSNCGKFLYGSDADEVRGRFCPSCGAEMIEKE